MSNITNYTFTVDIWEDREAGNFSWVVAEEFTCDDKEFVPIAWGTADSYDSAAETAWESVRQFLKES